tara:strand:+ start:43 stop:630 length:588 start_codon:yes stop_codon:yes gene_type:complete
MNTFTKVLLSVPLLFSTVACSSAPQASEPTQPVGFNAVSDDGYNYNFQESNITTRKVDKSGERYNQWYSPTHKVQQVLVVANGVVTDLTGKSEHFHGKSTCKVDGYTAYRSVRKTETFRWNSNRGSETQYHSLGWLTDTERKALFEDRNYQRQHGDLFSGETRVFVDKDDQMIVAPRYINEDQIVCQAARHFGLI